MLRSNCDLKTHVQHLGYPLPYKSGQSLQIWGQKTLFRTTSELNSNFNGLHLRNDTRYRQSVKCVDNYKESSIIPLQNVMIFSPQTASNWTAILPTLCKFCFLRHRQASQTKISKQNSTKRLIVNRANNLLL